jgi:hypothetical protein
VKITRPSSAWTSIVCPATSGWTVAFARSGNKVAGCLYTNATTPIAKGGSAAFSFGATPASGGTDDAGAWKVSVDADAGGVGKKNSANAAAASPGALTTTIYVWEVLDAVVANSSTAAGSPCPSSNKSAPGGSARVVTVCGKNHGNVAATPDAPHSSLAGTFVGTAGTFSSGSIAAGSSNVVLANYAATQVTSSTGSGKTVVARIGAAPTTQTRTSPLTTLAGYTALDVIPPAPPTFTSTVPASPSNDGTPLITGSAEAGSAVQLYKNGTCTGTPAGSGTAAEFSSPGIGVTVAADSTTTFHGVAIDASSNRSACSSGSITYVEDSTGPAVTLTAPADGSYTMDTTPTFSGAAGTASGDAATVTVEVHSGSTTSGPVVESIGTTPAAGAWSVDASPSLADGTYTARASQDDSAGNTGLSGARTFTVDTLPPAAPSFTSQPNDPSNDATPTWTFSGEAGATFDCKLMSGATVVRGFGACDGGTRSYDLTSEPDATYTINVRQHDLAGNVSPVGTSSYTLDRVAPGAPNILTGPTDPSADDSPTWTFSGDGTSTLECALTRGGTVVLQFSVCNSGSQTDDLMLEPDGTYTFRVRQTDPAGNTGPEATSNYTLARPLPAPTITAAPPAFSKLTHPAWSFTGAMGATFECQLSRGSTVVAALSACNSGTQSYDLSSEPDGLYTFKVRQSDGVNTSGVAVGSFHLDRVAPAGPTITKRAPSPSRRLRPSWSFTGEPNATFRCQLRRGRVIVFPFRSCTSPKTYNLTGQADGTYTFGVRQTDQAGNRSAVTSARYRLDRIAPRISRLRARPSPFDLKTAGRCAISFLLGESGSVTVEIKRGTVLVRRLAPRFYKAGAVKRFWDGKNARKRLVRAGGYTIVVTATDRAHNRRVKSITLTVKR